jgi:hypothetical protein
MQEGLCRGRGGKCFSRAISSFSVWFSTRSPATAALSFSFSARNRSTSPGSRRTKPTNSVGVMRSSESIEQGDIPRLNQAFLNAPFPAGNSPRLRNRAQPIEKAQNGFGNGGSRQPVPARPPSPYPRTRLRSPCGRPVRVRASKRPCSAMSFAARMNPARAAEASARPAEIYLTPRSSSWRLALERREAPDVGTQPGRRRQQQAAGGIHEAWPFAWRSPGPPP